MIRSAGAAVPAIILSLLAMAGCGRSRSDTPRLAVTLPFGAIDPIESPGPSGTLVITGWVLSEDPLQSVSLYLDGRYVTSAALWQPRPDVNRAYPAFGQTPAGWRIELDTTLFPGEHEVVVQARTAHDGVRELRSERMRFEARR